LTRDSPSQFAKLADSEIISNRSQQKCILCTKPQSKPSKTGTRTVSRKASLQALTISKIQSKSYSIQNATQGLFRYVCKWSTEYFASNFLLVAEVVFILVITFPLIIYGFIELYNCVIVLVFLPRFIIEEYHDLIIFCWHMALLNEAGCSRRWWIPGMACIFFSNPVSNYLGILAYLWTTRVSCAFYRNMRAAWWKYQVEVHHVCPELWQKAWELVNFAFVFLIISVREACQTDSKKTRNGAKKNPKTRWFLTAFQQKQKSV